MALVDFISAAVPGSHPQAHSAVNGEIVVVAAPAVLRVMEALKGPTPPCFDLLVDITAVDRIAARGKIEVVYQLCATATGERATIKAEVAGESGSLPSVTPLWRNADWAEREVWDMFGVRFEGHPDLRRILMYEEFVGHPLLKDYPYDKRQPLVPERDPINDPWPPRESRRK